MQSVTLAHGIEHATQDHADLCEVCVVAEKCSTLDITLPLLLESDFAEFKQAYAPSISLSYPISAYLGRAPPAH